MKNSQKGFISPLLLALIAILLIGGGAYVYAQNKQGSHAVVSSANQSVSTSAITDNQNPFAATSSWVPLSSTSTLPYIIKEGKVYYHDVVKDNSTGNTVFTQDYLIPGSDPSSLSVAIGLSTPTPFSYSKDRSHVYDFETPFPNADPNTFVPIFTSNGSFSNYSKDKNHIYFSYIDGPDNSVLPMIVSSDINNFVVLASGYDAYDKNHKYSWGKIVQ